MLWKCSTQYSSKSEKLSSGHGTSKGQFSFQSQRKALPKNAHSTAQLHSSHMLDGEGYGNTFQHSCLENPMDGGVWSTTVHGVGKRQTRLSDFTLIFHFHALEQATHSRIVACRIPGTEEPGGLPSMGSHRVRHDWSDLAEAAAHARTVMLQILQVRLQSYVNPELPYAQDGFRKGRDQIANILWIIERAR